MSANEKLTVQEKLVKIQQTLKAPKKQFNSFGKYKYRSCEDILEAVKPLLDGLRLTLTDEVVMVGERYYVKAEARLWMSAKTVDSSEYVTTTAYAREPENKKGMDESQITGTASSYARKYALNGLFLIDDNQDIDSQKPATYEISTRDAKLIANAKDLETLAKICGVIKKTKGEKYQKSLLAHYNARKEQLNESA